MENIGNKETDTQSTANEASDVKNTVTNAKPEKASSKNNEKPKKKKKKLNWKICLVAVIAGLLVWYITLNEGFKVKENDNGKAVIWFKGIRDIDFWIVLNSAFNDYRDLFEDNLEMYVKYAKDFIMDEDAKSNKVFKYFTIIPK